MVKISMDTFVKRFQPEKYDKWLEGMDLGPHPEDTNRGSVTSTSQMIKGNKGYVFFSSVRVR